MGWLEQQEFIVSLFWRLEVQDQGVSKPAREVSRPLSLAIFSLCLLTLSSSVHVYLRVQISPFYKDTSQIRLGPILITSF